jgi:hypothetical protein
MPGLEKITGDGLVGGPIGDQENQLVNSGTGQSIEMLKGQSIDIPDAPSLNDLKELLDSPLVEGRPPIVIVTLFGLSTPISVEWTDREEFQYDIHGHCLLFALPKPTRVLARFTADDGDRNAPSKGECIIK